MELLKGQKIDTVTQVCKPDKNYVSYGYLRQDDSSKKHTGDLFIVESARRSLSMPSAIDSTQALLSNTLQAASIPGASPAMHLGVGWLGPRKWQQEWDHNGESSANVVKQVLHWSEICIFLPTTQLFLQRDIFFGRWSGGKGVSCWSGQFLDSKWSQHLVVSFYLEEFKASTSREGWFIQEECVLNPPYSLIGDYLQTKCAIACIAGFFRLLTCLPLSRSKSHIPLHD